jgi:phage terminase large subunit
MSPSHEDTTIDYWIPRLAPKQVDLFNCFDRAVLVSGPRKTGKTIAIGHRICRHLWETPGARVAIFSKTIKNATDGGIWDDLIKIIVPEWIDSNIGFEYTTHDSKGIPGPRSDTKTKTLYFKVKNHFGGESELKLFSLDYDKDVEAKVKGTRFSMMWFSELSLFEDKNVFKVSLLQLRMTHLRRDQHMWIADTNPSDQGEDSWIYEYWYRNRMKKWDKDKDQKFWNQLALHEIFLPDNPFNTDDDVDELEALYADDPDGYERNVQGKWVKSGSSKGKHFSGVFNEYTHVIGGGDDGDAIDISPNTIDLFTGWDIGDVNHSAHILEKLLVNDKPLWLVHDEQVVIGDHVSTTDFTLEFLDKMDKLQEYYKKDFLWRHWSDDSAINAYRASSGSYDYLDVLAASQNRIMLEAAIKPDGSVRTRVKLLRQLLRENRIFVAARCKATIRMLKECKKGSAENKFVEHNEHKHPFDSLTYPLLMESIEDLVMVSHRPTARKDGKRPPISLGGV